MGRRGDRLALAGRPWRAQDAQARDAGRARVGGNRGSRPRCGYRRRDLDLDAKGDIEVDFHHTVEDAGITLGQAVGKALGEKKGIRRYGFAYVPMDEALVRAVIDLSGRPYLVYEPPSPVEAIGGNFSFQLVEEFLRAIAVSAAMNLHVEILAGRDAHHMAEGVFKALARALDAATQIDPRVEGVPSTKGVL